MAAYTAIDDPEAYFQVKLYSGTGSSLAVTLDGDTDMSPNLVWIKSRSHTNYHVATDTVRGVTEQIYPNDAGAEETTAGSLTVFGSDGFTVAGSSTDTNGSGRTYTAWCWNESATSGFDIVAYSGTGSARTVSHSLSATPHMIIIKRRDASGTWHVYHNALGADFVAAELDTNVDKKDNANFMNDTEPTSSVFTVNTYDEVNASSGTHVAYCFAPKQGFSKFGYYVGNGNANGPFVYTGFRPAFILYKNTDRDISWLIHDHKRLGYNINNDEQHSDTNAVDGTDDRVDILSNGFKIRADDSYYNGNGKVMVYAAFAEAPFVNSNGVPCNAR